MSFNLKEHDIETQAALIAHKAGLRLWDLDHIQQSKYRMDAELKLRLHYQIQLDDLKKVR